MAWPGTKMAQWPVMQLPGHDIGPVMCGLFAPAPAPAPPLPSPPHPPPRQQLLDVTCYYTDCALTATKYTNALVELLWFNLYSTQ